MRSRRHVLLLALLAGAPLGACGDDRAFFSGDLDGGATPVAREAAPTPPSIEAGTEDASRDAGDAGDAAALPTLTVEGGTIAEGAADTAPLAFLVRLSEASASEVSVDFATVDETATVRSDALFGADYLPTAGRLTFAPGELVKTVLVSVLGDGWHEGDETFRLGLANAANARIDTPFATGTIADDDAEPSISIDDALVIEGSGATTPARFVVRLSAPSALPLTVRWRTIEGTASDADFVAVADGTATFAPGETEQTVTVDVVGDASLEPNESFAVQLFDPTGATLGTSQGTGTIQDDDGRPRPTIAADATRLTETEGRWIATIPVRLSTPVTTEVRVDYVTRPGTAAAGPGGDFEVVQGTLTFAPGETVKNVSVPIVGDAVSEPDETFALRLSDAIGALIATADALVTIADDDTLPSITIADAASDESGVLAFTLALSAPSGQQVAVDFRTIDGTAKSGGEASRGERDFVAAGGPVVFAPGQTTQTVYVSVVGDALDEDDETFEIALASPTNAVLGAKARATGTILDDDDLPILLVASPTVDEGNAGLRTVTVTARLAKTLVVDGVYVDQASGRRASFRYETRDHAAIAGEDYVAASGEVVFEPGETVKTITLQVIGDRVQENGETFGIVFSELTNVTRTLGPATVTIRNDDAPRPRLSIEDASGSDGGDSFDLFGAEHIDFVVRLSEPATEAVTFRCTPRRGAYSEEITTVSSSSTIPAGETVSSCHVNYHGDRIYEGPSETFEVELSNVSTNVDLGRATAVGTILENDPAPRIAIENGTADEGTPPAANKMRFRVTLDRASAVRTIVTYATAPGTAVPTGTTETGGRDYVSIPATTLVFEPNETEKFIEVDILADRVEELTETFSVNLLSAVNGTIAHNSAIGTIVNDDTAVLSVFAATVPEGAARTTGLLELRVELSTPRWTPTFVDVATANGTATAGADYLPFSGRITFAPGETRKQVWITVLGDDRSENHETILFTVRSGALLLTATGLILDDD